MKKQKIFISANQKELRDERFAVKEVVLNNSSLRNCFDVFLFEDLPAKSNPPSSTYLKEVAGSDIYLGIFGNEYGVKGRDGLSATEREFRHFIKQNPHGDTLIYIKGATDSQKDKDVQKLIKSARERSIYKRFNTVVELKVQVLNSLISCIDEKGLLNRLPFDKRLNNEAGYSDIDEKEVRDFLQNRALKLKVGVPRIPVREFLVKTLKVVHKSEDGKFIPSNTALLFFGKDPSEFISQNEIRIARFKGTTRSYFIDSAEINGPIYKMLDQVEKFFIRNTRLANKIVEFKRVDIPEYPYEAIREAVINAIAHRDYTRLGAPIMISIFDDRVEISNAGGLLPGMNIKKLEGHHVTRNENICRIFHETLDMERFGTGVGKMKRLMKGHGLKYPEFFEEGDFFVSRFFGPGDKILDLVPSIPKERQTDLKELGLNERQIEALRLMVNENKNIEIDDYYSRFRVNEKTARRDLKKLVSLGFVEKVGSTKKAFFRAKDKLPKK
ncbi:MAG: ATP-binding protein [Elusimicrobiota bacterium]